MAPTAPASGCCGGRGRGRWTWRRTEDSNRLPSGLSVPNAGFSVDGSWADRGRGVEWSLNRLGLEGAVPVGLVLSCPVSGARSLSKQRSGNRRLCGGYDSSPV